ncbi:hypothetical protein Tco_0857361 [Tanacetum coccineum]|uniref:Uncharacterized protein n=1 Tax=Tanacetum coccineum TaxID=301880 RepID=A0ABQ5BAA4_9ASTR
MQKYILKQQFEGFTVSNSDGIHKGYERFQSLLSQLEIHGAGVSTEDANQKFLRSLPSAWLQVSLIRRNITNKGRYKEKGWMESGNKVRSRTGKVKEESKACTEPSELVSEPVVVNESNIEVQPKVWSDAPIIEEYESDSDDEYVSVQTKGLDTPSFANKQVNTPRENVKNQSTHSQKPKDNPHRTLKNKGIIDSGCSQAHDRKQGLPSMTFKTSMVGLFLWKGSNVSTASPNKGLSKSDSKPMHKKMNSGNTYIEDIHEDATDGIFTHYSYDDVGAEADFINLETVWNVSIIPSSRINPSHPSAIFLGDSKHLRTNKSLCKVPKKISKALVEDEKLVVDAMQENFCSFEIQKSLDPVDLRYGEKRLSVTKWGVPK